MSNAAGPQISVLPLSTLTRQQLPFDDSMPTRLLERAVQAPMESPFATLPPEIAAEIFAHCLPAKRQSDVVNPTEAPLLLTQVCGLWRNIAISTPELWATFDLQIGWPEPHLQEIGETWLRRAHERPISVKLSSFGLLSEIDHIDRFMTTLWGRSRQMRALNLKIAVEDFDVVDGPLRGPDFCTLQKLSIHVVQQGLGGDASDYGPLALFSNAPMLYEVVSEIPPSFITLPWHQLTKFTGEIYTIAECLEALRLMPNLTHCAFAAFDLSSSPARSFSNDMVAQDDPKILMHANLQHLELFQSTSDSALVASSARVLAFLTLPGLNTLEFRGVKDYDKSDLDSFLSRSSPPLRKLTIHPHESQTGGTDLCLTRSFTTLPLTDLEVWHPEGHLLLGFLGKHTSLLPHLQNLYLLGCRDTDRETVSSPVCVAEMGTSIAKGAKLQSFRVVSESGCTFSEEDLLPFKQLKASGMDVHIGTEGESIV
ncbi:hypothetical protein K438DRAFT_992767 [Mycena galopus ATCC 62051]|nr:hypothetical protein K438DRAFT_992767 [Mycena galopus ATCC 62051]